MKPSRVIVAALCVLMAAAIIGGTGVALYRWWRFPIWVEEQAGIVEASYRAGDFARAVQAAEQLAANAPTRIPSIRRGAQAALQLQDRQRAWRLLETALGNLESRAVPPALEPELMETLLLQGALATELQRPAAAERAYRRALSLRPQDQLARERLSLLLTLLGRFDEARPMMFELVREGHVREQILSILGTHEPVFRGAELLEAALRHEPESPWPHLGLARIALYDGDYERARRHLADFLEAQPNHGEAYGVLGRVLLHSPPDLRAARIAQWFQTLPAAVTDHPDVWLVRGLWAERQQDYRGAARCFLETLRRDPCHPHAATRLAGCLTASGEPTAAELVVAQARHMEELDSRCHLMQQSGATVRGVARIAQLCEQLGRFWEAAGWAQLFLRRPAPSADDPTDPNALSRQREYGLARQQIEQLKQRVERQLSPELDRVAKPFQVAAKIDIHQWPVPQITTEVATRRPAPSAQLQRRPHFVDVSAAAGIRFTFENADDPATPGRRLIETTGGGVAVLDYDQDGWPDLYFTNGGPWPSSNVAEAPRDRLYRNLGNGTFLDVTSPAGLGDRSFSQGAAAGDINNDGWPDLLVCNLGRNRLYLNNADGTFTDISASASLTTEYWSTSAAIADLNLDGVSDLFITNYLYGDRAYFHICGSADRPRVCSPAECDSAPDQLFLGNGDGTWSNHTRQAAITGERGNGLGCIVADLAGDRRMSIFVANDATANFCYVNTAPPGKPPSFRESAVLLGLAFSADGRSQGCMGVAAGDYDRDSKLDLFVTNFYREPNALYHQQEGGLFLDESAATGIASFSESMLGFGTQFLDAELDGLLDIVVTNGHIDDLSDQGVPYRMQPQYLRNLGGRFAQWPSHEAGGYFQRKLLGRGLARVDFDLDGREDFVVSHLDDPAALIANRSENAGHYLAIELSGTTSARDAIGSRIRVRTNGYNSVRQLIAGDGYQASNHRRLVFGLGDITQVDAIEIDWPSGATTRLGSLPADQTIRVTEEGDFYRLPHTPATPSSQD